MASDTSLLLNIRNYVQCKCNLLPDKGTHWAWPVFHQQFWVLYLLNLRFLCLSAVMNMLWTDEGSSICSDSVIAV